MSTHLRLIIKRESVLIGFVLTLAEASMSKAQFPAFKKLLLDHFHKQHRPELQRLLAGANESQGPGSAVSDNSDGKEGAT